MYCLQNGKLYILCEDKMVGVDVTPTSTIKHEDECAVFKDGLVLTPSEVCRKFQICDGNSYIFPCKKKEKPKTKSNKTKTTKVGE